MANPDEYADDTPEEFDLGAAADAAFDDAAFEAEENDEVLVFQMEDEEGPYLPDGVDGDPSATYALPPGGDADEFSELGDEWDARANGEEYDPQPAAPDRRKAIAAAAALGAVVAVLAFAFSGGDEPAGDQVAKVENGTRATKDAPRAKVGASNAPADEIAVDSEPVQQQERAPRSMVAGLGALFGAADDTTYGSGVPMGPDATGPGGDGEYASNDDVASSSDRVRREGVVDYRDQVVLPGPLPNIAFASDTVLSSVWTKDSLPPEGAAGENYLQTPFVGMVRVHTDRNEFFDGRLVGLGGGRVVLTTSAGDLTLESSHVALTERLVGGIPTAGSLVAKTTGERVRVHVAGGWLGGQVVSEEDEAITLLLDTGGRITVERRDVRPDRSANEVRLAHVPEGI
ncbi:MAG: hypothetical protein R3F34_07275 [Planctomycetota bacterium]